MRSTVATRPTLALLAVLALALPTLARAGAGSPAAPAIVYPTCGDAVGDPSPSDTVLVSTGGILVQPLPDLGNLASIQSSVFAAYYSTAQMRVIEWDPVALVPDPTAITLRSRAYDPSALANGWTRFDFVPPIVTRTLAHVADPPRSPLAWVWKNDYPYTGSGLQYLRTDATGDAGWPVARQGFTPYSPLPGSHPVLGQRVCLGDPALQNLRIAQVIDHNDTDYGAAWDSFLLRFRVPSLVRLRWIELALSPGDVNFPYEPGTVSVLDAQGQNVPPPTPTGPLVQADFATGYRAEAGWVTHNDFDALVTLEPNHDYWLHVQTRHSAYLRAHSLRGGESPDYAAGIGEMYARQQPGDPWTLQEGHALGFKLVGDPLDPVGVPAPPRPFAFAVSPNPVRNEVTMQWSEARGTLRVAVLDVRGRRVGGTVIEAHGAGTWRWRAIDAQGRALPAGVYFVRATDDEGRAGVRRVVVVR